MPRALLICQPCWETLLNQTPRNRIVPPSLETKIRIQPNECRQTTHLTSLKIILNML